jgi:dihydroneopterin aldolase
MLVPTFTIKGSCEMKIESYKIELSNIRLYAFHGVLPQENIVGAWYIVDLTATVDSTESISNDNLDSTVNYAEIYEAVCLEMKIDSKLLEHVCGRILSKLFERFPSISDIEISLKKETPPLGGDSLSSAVRIKAARD